MGINKTGCDGVTRQPFIAVWHGNISSRPDLRNLAVLYQNHAVLNPS